MKYFSKVILSLFIGLIVLVPSLALAANNNFYVNASGVKVHIPVKAQVIPKGASAKCKDGTYSFSQNRRGTCSGHGGVSKWLK